MKMTLNIYIHGKQNQNSQAAAKTTQSRNLFVLRLSVTESLSGR